MIPMQQQHLRKKEKQSSNRRHSTFSFSSSLTFF
jgi:hypothetical protein